MEGSRQYPSPKNFCSSTPKYVSYTCVLLINKDSAMHPGSAIKKVVSDKRQLRVGIITKIQPGIRDLLINKHISFSGIFTEAGGEPPFTN